MKLFDKLRGRKEPTVSTEVSKSAVTDVLDLTSKAGYSPKEYWPDRLDDNTSPTLDSIVSKSITRTVEDFAVVDEFAGDSAVAVGDSCNGGTLMTGGFANTQAISPALAGWYSSQGFIGHQMCAIIAQNWLVSKACAMPAEDAIRNGWTTDFKDVEDSDKIEELDLKLKAIDERMGLDRVMMEAAKFANVFGIRILIPLVDSTDPDYYKKKFNIDGITPGSFRGWVQIDPQWIYPLLSSVGASNPASPEFYEPTFWQAGGVTYHRSHLVILRTEEVADVLKPSYLFGGLPLTQRIAERVYAAERTANEAPLLAMAKRTTVLKVDLVKAKMKLGAFVARMQEWVSFRDNSQVRVVGKDEDVSQIDTSLADLDTVIMTQYQIVAAIAQVPATKLLGTSPKGFNATGEHEMKSYHEYLESIQSTWFDQFLERHYLLVSHSYMDGIEISHTWEPVDVIGAKDAADIQKVKADTAAVYIDAGVISPDEERSRIRMDKESGYALAADVDAPLPPVPEPEPTGPDNGDGNGDGDVLDDGGESIDSENLENEEDERINSLIQGDDAPVGQVDEALVLDIVAKLVEALQSRQATKQEQTYATVTASVKGVTGIEPGVKPLPTPPAHLAK
jgi:phage-related protein (TIGR01555 family)